LVEADKLKLLIDDCRAGFLSIKKLKPLMHPEAIAGARSEALL
jgi:hypothetical protein